MSLEWNAFVGKLTPPPLDASHVTCSVCSERHTRLYTANPFNRDFSGLVDTAQTLPVTTPPRLVVVSIDKERSLFSPSPEAEATLRRAFDAIIASLHPTGVIAVAIPRPWHHHVGRILGEWIPVLDPPSKASLAVSTCMVEMTHLVRFSAKIVRGT